MKVARLALRHFRNLAAIDLDVPPEGAVLVGDNGHGKTNLLEAIYYFVLFRSFRGAPDRDLVQFGEAGFHLEVVVENGTQRSHNVAAGFELASGRKRVAVDRGDLGSLSDGLGTFRAVVLSPADHVLATGSPAARRRYLDVILSVTQPRYLEALRQYRRALRQRNAALKRQRAFDAQAFEPVLGQAGRFVSTMRHEWVDAQRTRYRDLVATIGEVGLADMSYRGSLDVDYADTRRRDLERGSTGDGPHRGDLDLRLDGRRVAETGSAGQQRTAAIALRLLEAAALTDPVLLLDDVFAELDDGRRERLAELLEGRQRLLAVPREAGIPQGAASLPRWAIDTGKVRAA